MESIDNKSLELNVAALFAKYKEIERWKPTTLHRRNVPPRQKPPQKSWRRNRRRKSKSLRKKKRTTVIYLGTQRVMSKDSTCTLYLVGCLLANRDWEKSNFSSSNDENGENRLSASGR
jgi:hypothetical protein